MYCGTEKYPQIIEEAQFKAVAKLIATKYGGYNNDARATVLRKRTFCQECGERIWHDMQHPKYRRWVCKKCNEHPIKDDDFYKKVTGILNAVIDHPELLDEVEPKDTYESEYEVTSKANQVTHMLTSPGVNFESAFEDILNLASLKYDNCEYDITEELTETIKQDYIGRQRLDDVDTELIERTVGYVLGTVGCLKEGYALGHDKDGIHYTHLDRVEWLCRCGLATYIPELQAEVDLLANAIDENGICRANVDENQLKGISTYGGQQLEVDWKTDTRKLCDVTFRAILIMFYANKGA